MSSKLKVMISQPMRGKTNEQIRQERAELVKKLEKDNFEVVDTIISENAPRGCKIENKICQEYEKQTMYNIYEE